MTFLPFDTYSVVDTRELAKEAEQKWEKGLSDKDDKGFIYAYKLLDATNKMRLPFSVCDFFGIKYDLQKDGEFIWEKVEDIKIQLDYELKNLMTNGVYKSGINAKDNSFGIFYKKDLNV